MKFNKIYGLALAVALSGASAKAADVGKPAQDFTIMTYDFKKIGAAELKGKVVVLNYWATWCTPCKAEMITFDNYMRAHPGTDLKIYSIATEDSVDARKLRPLMSVLSFPLARNLHGRGYGVMDGVPTTYVIDRSGVVRWAKAGAFDKESFDELITPLLAQAPPAEPATAVASAR